MKQVNFKARFRDLQNRLVFFRFVGDQTQTSARLVFAGTLNHELCNVYSSKAFETLIHENVTYIVFFVVCKIYFRFGVFDSEQTNVSERARIASFVRK